jgi:hypothetical protein
MPAGRLLPELQVSRLNRKRASRVRAVLAARAIIDSELLTR